MESLQSILSESSSVVDEIRGQEPQVVDREPSREPSREVTEPSEAKQAPAKSADAGDDEDEAEIDLGEPSLDKLQAALKSERSITRRQRKELKEALNRLRTIESQHQQTVGHVSALHQQMATRGEQPKPPEQKQPDDWDTFLSKGPEYVRSVVEQAITREREAAMHQQVQARRAHIDASERAFYAKHTDAAETIAYFREMAAADPSLAQQFAQVVEGRHPSGYSDPVKWAYDVAKASKRFAQYSTIDEYEQALRKQWEAEHGGDTGGGESRGTVTRLAQKTLAGTRGGGAGVTREWSGQTPLKELFG